MKNDTEDRKQSRIWMSKSAKAAVEDYAKEKDMTQEGIISRLILWWADQPKPLRSLILRLYDDEVEIDVARILLERMTAPEPKDLAESGRPTPLAQHEESAKHSKE